MECDASVNNDPVLCTNCERVNEWPKCMEGVKLRGYHPILKESCWDDITDCSNYREYYNEI